MNDKNPYMNNPLQGVGLNTVLEELVDHYGFEILNAYLNMNCFKTNPSVAACAKFLKKTTWAREKVELFYLYQYKNLPKVSSEQFNIEPRERIVPEHQKPGEPAILTIEEGERLQNKRSKNAASHNEFSSGRNGSGRQHNERRNSPQRLAKARENRLSKQAGDREAEADNTYEEAKPAEPFNPWDNLKKKK